MFYFQLNIQQRADGGSIDGFPVAKVGGESKKRMDVISVQGIKNVIRRFV